MLELFVCSLLTILPDYLYRRYRQGKRIRPRDHAVLGLVRVALGHHRMPDAHRKLDHDNLLFPSVHDGRYVIFPDRSDRPGDVRARCRNLREDERQSRKRRPDFSTRRCNSRTAAETSRRRIAEVDAQLSASPERACRCRGSDWCRLRAPISKPSMNWRPSRNSIAAARISSHAGKSKRLQTLLVNPAGWCRCGEFQQSRG